MLVSGIWKLAAMAGVIGVGLVAVYQAQQGLPKTSITAPDGGGGEPDDTGNPDENAPPDPLASADPASAIPPETPNEPNPFGENPFGAPGLANKPPTGRGAAQPNLAVPGVQDDEPNPFAPNPVIKPSVTAKVQSGPGVDFRGDPVSPREPESIQDPHATQPADLAETAPKRLPDELDPFDQGGVKTAELTAADKDAGESTPASRQPAIRPFVRQARNDPDPLNGTGTKQSTGNDPDKSDADPFDTTPSSVPLSSASTPIPDPADDLTDTPRSNPKTAPKTEPGFDGDPFGDTPAGNDPPRATPTGSDLSAPADVTSSPSGTRPLSLPEEDLSTPFAPSNGTVAGTKAAPADVPETALPAENPRRGRSLPRLPTEIPDSVDDTGFGSPPPSKDFSAAPPERISKPAREPASERALPRDTLLREPDKVPSRRPADSVPKTLDNDLIGDGTINNASPRGIQQARLMIEKIAPQQATLGEPLVYSVIVKNVGNADAHQVLIEDRIPKGTELSGTAPRAEMIDKRLVWRIGTLKPNEEKKISIRVIPHQEGPIGSVARVSFATEVAAEILVAAPQLSFNVKAPRQVRMGETIELTFLLKNTGTAAATNVSVRDLVPAGLKHEASSDIECPIGRLAPNESREIVLNVTAVKPGRATNRAILSGDAGIRQELETSIDIVGEQLVLTRSGQTKIYVDRPAQFTNNVKNEGNAAVKNVRVAEVVPAGMDFVEASDGGRFDPVQRAIFWDLGALPPGAEAAVSSKLVARAAGTLQASVTATGPAGSTAAVKSDVDVVGRPELQIETISRTGIVAVGDRLTSKIQLKNHGSAAAKNVSLSIRLPRELKLIEVRGGQYTLRDNVIAFDAVAAIGPKEFAAYELVMEAVSEADAQMNLEISAEHLSKPARRSETVQIAAEIR